MTVFQPLYSGSSGNCSLVTNDLCGHGGALLIDAGVSCRAILEGLSQAQVQPCQLSGILITHEHSDHIKGLRVFAKRFRTPVYASRKCWPICSRRIICPKITLPCAI